MKVTNKVLATVFLSAGAGVDGTTLPSIDFRSGPGPSPPRDKSTPIGSVKVVGSDAGYCEGISDQGIANTTAGCDANYVLNAAVYPDGSVKGKAVDVFALAVDLFGDNGAILVAGDVSCLKFFEVADGEDAGSYAVASGIIEQGPEGILNLPYVSAAKINSTGSFYFAGYGIGDPNVTCDDFDETFLSSRFGPHRTGTFEINPPVVASEGCDELNVKQCRKTNGCKWVGDNDVGECVSKDDDGFGIVASDIRLKKDIHCLGKSPSGIPVYSFKYREDMKDVLQDEDTTSVYFGAMAQDLLELAPEAVGVGPNGYYSVDYSKIDVDFIKLV